MKILSLTYEYPPIGGGGGVVAAALNKTLAAAGHEVQVVTCAMKGLKSETIDGVRVHRTSCVRRYRHYTTSLELLTTLLPAYRQAVRLIREERPDVIHAHFVFPTGIVAYLLFRKFNIPYVLTAHGSDIPDYNPDRFGVLHQLGKPLWRKIMKAAAAVTSPSEFLAGLIRRHVDVPIHIVPNGYTATQRPSVAKRNLVLVVARLFPRKGVQHFIESVRNLHTDWEMVVAGDGPYMDSLKELASESTCPVRFVGFVDRATLQVLYQEARIFVFPSIRENFPVVLLEAMDAGCAVITTDAEGCAEVVGDCGIVIQAGSSGQIRTALDGLMADADRRNELSRLARRRVQLFRWSRIARLYREAFTSVLPSSLAATSVPAITQRRSATTHEALSHRQVS